MRYVLLATLLLGASAAVAGCGPDIPAHPTYEVDVKPIIYARCNRCHNGNYGDPLYLNGGAGVSFQYPDFQSIESRYYTPGQGTSWDDAVHAIPGALSGGRMPPPPSAALEDWQVEIIDRWSADPK